MGYANYNWRIFFLLLIWFRGKSIHSQKKNRKMLLQFCKDFMVLQKKFDFFPRIIFNEHATIITIETDKPSS